MVIASQRHSGMIVWVGIYYRYVMARRMFSMILADYRAMYM
jgi:hypothetical protein